jgi:hypothetical protein
MNTLVLPDNWKKRIDRALANLPAIHFGKISLTIEISCGNSPGMLKVKQYFEEDVRVESVAHDEHNIVAQ